MDTFYHNLVQASKQNLHKRLEVEQNNQIAHQMKIKNAMTSLFSEIQANFDESKLSEIASNGYNKCELFSFEKGEMYQDFPLVFLTRGPQNYNGFGIKYFEDMNIIPYMKLLQQHFAPFNIYYGTNYKTGKTSVNISWST